MYSRILGVGLALTAALVLFQNCGQPVSFNTSDPLSSVAATDTDPPAAEPIPVPEKGDLQFDVQTSQTQHLPLVKLIMVVDNSDSMSRYQTLLANGVKGMLDKLKAQKLNIDFHLYTTSAIAGAAYTSAEQLPLEYRDASGKVITEAEAKDRPHVRNFKFRLAPSIAQEKGAPLGFRATMSDAQLKAASDEIEKRIKAVGTTGSDQESGLCTILRALKDKDANKIMSPGDRVALVVLSDEDDSIRIDNCYSEAQEEYKTASALAKCATGTACNAPYTYRATYNHTNLLKFSLVYDNPACVRDGGLTEACQETKTTSIDCAKSSGLCPSGMPANKQVTCSSGQASAAASALSLPVDKISSCKVTHAESTTTLSLTNQAERGLCAKSFSAGGVTYANVEDYMKKKYPTVTAAQWRNVCTEYGMVDSLKKTSSGVTKSLVDAGSAPVEQVKKHLTDTLGANSFRVSFVINDAKANVGETCPAGTEKNKGLLYRALGDALPKQSFVSSICAANYDAAMGDLGKFIESVALRTYPLSITKAKAAIESVIVVRAGSIMPVDPADYSLATGAMPTLTFKDGLLQPGDKVRVKWVEVLN